MKKVPYNFKFKDNIFKVTKWYHYFISLSLEVTFTKNYRWSKSLETGDDEGDEDTEPKGVQ